MQLEHVTNFSGLSLQGSVKDDDVDHPLDVLPPPRMALHTHIWSAPDLTSGPLLPFRIIRHMAMECPAMCMQAASAMLGQDCVKPNTAQTPNKLTTSCRNTAFAVLFLFLGAKKALFTIKNLERESIARFVGATSSGLQFRLKIRGLTYNGILAKINKNKEFVDLKKVEQKRRREIFEQQNEREVSTTLQKVSAWALSNLAESVTEEKMKQTILDACTLIDFNLRTIRALSKEIWQHQSEKDVHSEQSFLYCINTFCDKGDTLNHEHICILEQFFYADTNTIRFRLHQSWIGEATLQDNILQRKYDDSGEISMRYIDVLGFLTLLEERYCQSIYPPKRTSQKECFGFGSKERSSIAPYFEKQTLQGISLRYLCLPCHPGKASHHLNELIECYPDLQPYFYPHS